ncbi:MAG TPA: hypothetical protein VE057_05120 [Archangium sp.]|nr:hypothetical protein [Archangium sp.]
MKRIRSFGVLSFGKYLAVFNAFMGFLIGLMYGGFMMLFSAIGLASGAKNVGPMAALGIGGGIAAIIFIPIVYALFGFIGGIIATAFANIALRMTGGLELDIED